MATANSKKTADKRVVGKPFTKGKSGNPSGRPKLPEEFKELAKNNSIVALKKVIDILTNTESDNKDKLKAAEIIMDRAYGKATTVLDAEVTADVKNNIAIDLTALSTTELKELIDKNK